MHPSLVLKLIFICPTGRRMDQNGNGNSESLGFEDALTSDNVRNGGWLRKWSHQKPAECCCGQLLIIVIDIRE